MAYQGNKYEFDFFDYAYDTLAKIPLASLRKDYSRFRSVARKRLDRLESTNKDYIRESEFTNRWLSQRPKPLAEITSRAELIKAMSDVMRFLSAKASMVSGQEDTRRKKIETLQKHGYNVNRKNFEDFIREIVLLKERQGEFYVMA